MSLTSAVPAEPDPSILFVGQDPRGRWMVQENHGLLEGTFVSREAAMSFARWERHGYPGATVALATAPLTPHFAH